MVVAPQSNIILLKVPLTLDNKNQLTFASKQAQFNYFNGLSKIEMDNATYVRKDNKIYFDEKYDNLIQYNYLMYQNESYSDKWFYAFITNMNYENNQTTSIEFITDVWQTWQFDITF